jgi:hypothetical protein
MGHMQWANALGRPPIGNMQWANALGRPPIGHMQLLNALGIIANGQYAVSSSIRHTASRLYTIADKCQVKSEKNPGVVFALQVYGARAGQFPTKLVIADHQNSDSQKIPYMMTD